MLVHLLSDFLFLLFTIIIIFLNYFFETYGSQTGSVMNTSVIYLMRGRTKKDIAERVLLINKVTNGLTEYRFLFFLPSNEVALGAVAQEGEQTRYARGERDCDRMSFFLCVTQGHVRD